VKKRVFVEVVRLLKAIFNNTLACLFVLNKNWDFSLIINQEMEFTKTHRPSKNEAKSFIETTQIQSRV
jgi:hypothetical protein